MTTSTILTKTKISYGLSLITFVDDFTGLYGYALYRINGDGSYKADAGPYLTRGGFASEGEAQKGAIEDACAESIRARKNVLDAGRK